MMTDVIMLTEEGFSEGSQSEEDFYSSQPGDGISSTKIKDRRRTYLGLTCVFSALILLGISVAFGSAIRRQNNEDSTGKQMIASPDNDLAVPTPTTVPPTAVPVTAVPTMPPTTAAPTQKRSAPTIRTAPPVPSTLAPSTLAPTVTAPTAAPTAKKTLTEYVNEWLGPDALLDESSIAFQAYTWLSGNTKLDIYDSVAFRQRFSAAALHLATNVNASWNVMDGWMTNENECDWYGIECNDQGFLITFNLTSNGLSGLIPNEIELLSETLLSLILSYNDLENSYEQLSWLAELTNLRALDVQSTYFQADGIPSYLGNLKEMRILDISYTQFNGPIDGAIFTPMKELLYLEMGGNSYNSAVPAGIASLPELEALYLDDCDLEGDLSFILDLEASSIYEIWLDGNPALGGRIPTEIGDHTKLASLSISNCALTGPIPSEIGRLSDMEQIWVYGNNLEGEIPSEIGNLDRLKTLQVEDNPLLYGNMPDEICALRDVTPGLLALGSDCDSGDVTCDCCTCCEAPCSVVVGRRHLMEASYWI